MSFSEDELEEANGNNPIDLELDQNKESRKEVFSPLGKQVFVTCPLTIGGVGMLVF